MTQPAVQALRALLLTDVVDSTQLSQRLGDAATAAVWAAHDRLARDLLPLWRGREIDKTDGMLLLFDRPADAAHYALAYHRALAGLQPPLPARAGLHVGPVLLRATPAEDVARGAKPLEVDALAKPTAARVMALARGGQTLLSAEAQAALVAEGLFDREAGLATRSHGHWLLKGVAEPVELFELGPHGCAFQAPDDGDKAHRVVRQGADDGGRWLPVRQIANNLPVQLTSFIGRARELAELKALLGEHRLLTLLGMGGLGKTRLSLQLAAEVLADFPDGVWFIDLAPLRDGALVTSAAAQALGVRDEPGRPLLQALCAHLQHQRVLLILDNCEHLLAPVARLAHALLLAAPQLVIVASSREALHLPGERISHDMLSPAEQRLLQRVAVFAGGFSLAKHARDRLQGPAQGRWLAQPDTEHDNLRIAMATAMTTAQAGEAAGGDPFVAVKLAVALQNFWIMRGHVREGRDALAAIRALPAVMASDQALGHALYVAASLALAEGDPAEAQGDAQEALALFRAAGHQVGEAITLLQLGEAQTFTGDDAAALVHLHQAHGIAQAIRHPETEGEVERALADLALAAGEVAAAADGYARSLAVCAGAGDLRAQAQARALAALAPAGDVDRAAPQAHPAAA